MAYTSEFWEVIVKVLSRVKTLTMFLSHIIFKIQKGILAYLMNKWSHKYHIITFKTVLVDLDWKPWEKTSQEKSINTLYWTNFEFLRLGR